MNRGTQGREATERFSLKDELFNENTVRYLADMFSDHFEVDPFVARVVAAFPQLELKERITAIAMALAEELPHDMATLGPVIERALPPPLDPTKTDDDFGHFIFAPLGTLVEHRGLTDQPDIALRTLFALTQRFSMEFSIRAFLNTHPDLTLGHLSDWAEDDNYHVRRLVSEGTRPRLPWGAGIKLPFETGLAFLDRLYADPTRYVTRSVANHLNDISKKEPDLVVDRLQRWQNEGRQEAAEMAWMTKHALRGLQKAGHPRALALLGYDDDPQVSGTLTLSPDPVVIGEKLTAKIDLVPLRDEAVALDLVLCAEGRETGRHYKVKTVDLRAGDDQTMRKVLTLKGTATTYRLVPGAYRIDLRANGKLLDRQNVTLR